MFAEVRIARHVCMRVWCCYAMQRLCLSEGLLVGMVKDPFLPAYASVKP
jgi:hypothetical protein